MATRAPRNRSAWNVIFTSRGTEAVRESADYLRRLHGFEVSFLDVDKTRLVDAAALAAALRDDMTLVTIMYANNEVGTIQPVAELAAVAAAAGVPFHTDTVQAAG